jgi:hypothetical protein
MTQEQIVRETVAFYTSKNRAAVEVECELNGCGCISPQCLYLTDEGKMCAVGRCMTKKGLERVLVSHPKSSAHDLDDAFDGIDKLLKKKYHGQNISFWANLQRLHDNKNWWDENGITENGKAEVFFLFKIKL